MSECAGLGFARFLELRGCRVIEKGGVLWHSVGFGMYMNLPYHQLVEWEPDEAERNMLSMRVVGIRYSSLISRGLPSGLYVCRRKDYDIGTLHRNFRSQVRHSLASSEVRRVTEEELLTQALAINRETMQRQNRYEPEFGDTKRWRRFVRAIEDCPCITPIGAFVDGRLASYAITCLEEGWLDILYKMNSYQSDERHPSQVLDFTLTRRIATDPTISAVSMGVAPLVSSKGLHEYKMRLGYEFESRFSVIRLHPALRKLPDRRLGLWALRAVGRVRQNSQWPRQAAAVLDGARKTQSGDLAHTFQNRTYHQVTLPEESTQCIRDAGMADLPDIIEIHQKAFEKAFLTRLGPHFLELYYSSILSYPDHIFLLIENNQAVLGFVSGFLEPTGFYKLMQGRGWRFALTTLQQVISKPSLLWPAIRGFRRVMSIASTQEVCRGCELSSIAVRQEAAGHDLGKALGDAFLKRAWNIGARCVRLTTHATSLRSNDVYRRLGFQMRAQSLRGRGRPMNEYTIAGGGAPECATSDRCPFNRIRQWDQPREA